MNGRILWMVTGGLIVLVLGGSLLATNMGFKIVYPLFTTYDGISASGTNSLALPYLQHNQLIKAGDLVNDINVNAGTAIVLSLAKFIRSADALMPYTSMGTNFTLVPGEGYRVQVSQDVDYHIAGFHDPAAIIHLETTGTNNSKSGTNDVAYPYHGIAETASDLMQEINAAAGTPVVKSIAKFVRTTDSLLFYNGSTPVTDFALEKGASYRIQVTSDVEFRPAHY